MSVLCFENFEKLKINTLLVSRCQPTITLMTPREQAVLIGEGGPSPSMYIVDDADLCLISVGMDGDNPFQPQALDEDDDSTG